MLTFRAHLSRTCATSIAVPPPSTSELPVTLVASLPVLCARCKIAAAFGTTLDALGAPLAEGGVRMFEVEERRPLERCVGEGLPGGWDGGGSAKQRDGQLLR